MSNLGKKSLFFIGGSISLTLGFIGIFLPLLPTTPFLLLASFCFIRSSERIHRWLIQHPLFGTYLNNYIHHGGITSKDRIKALLLLWAGLGFSSFIAPNMHLKLFLLLIGSLVSLHLFKLRTLTAPK